MKLKLTTIRYKGRLHVLGRNLAVKLLLERFNAMQATGTQAKAIVERPVNA